MCTGVELAPLLIAAAGTTASAVNKNQALRRQDRELARGIIAQGKLDRESSQRLQQELESLGTSGPDQERRKALEGFRETLQENQDLAEGNLGDVSGANPRFAEAVATGRQTVGTRGQKRAGLLSRIDAPLRQRQTERQGIGRLGIDFGDIAQRSQAEDFLARLRASEERPNPFVDALASFATAFGGAKALQPPKPKGANFAKLLGAGTLVDAPVEPVVDTGIFNA